MLNRLAAGNVKVTGNRLTINFNCEGQIKKFFTTNRFFAEYNSPIDNMPNAILIIPFLATVAPVAWANQAEIHVETVDENFLQSLETVKKSMQTFYPRLKLGGSVQAKNVVKLHVDSEHKGLMLFSGGADSLATYIRHRGENLTLVHVYTDLAPKKQAERNGDIVHIREFCARNNLPLRTISSNFKFVPDGLMLSSYDKFIDEETDFNWWTRVMHGLALIGLSAPLAYTEKTEKLYIASSYTAEFVGGWGSHPDIDNNVKWAGIKVVHDGYDLSRQAKMNIIADYAKNIDKNFILRCCMKPENGENCNRCEKCSRTIVGLELAGLDPSKYGFKIETETFSSIRNKLEKGEWEFGDDQRFMWGDLKGHACQKNSVVHPEAKAFIEWLSTMNVNSFPSAIGRSKFDLKRYMWPLFECAPSSLRRILKKFYYFCLIVFPFMK